MSISIITLLFRIIVSGNTVMAAGQVCSEPEFARVPVDAESIRHIRNCNDGHRVSEG